ncbi:uncharacterized protein zgc:66472 isoform X4 [Tachysurus ichikawai]
MSSPVWKFFKVSDKDVQLAVCNVCRDEIPRGGSKQRHFNTTNMIRHLRTCHTTEYAEYKKRNQPKPTTSPSLNQPTEVGRVLAGSGKFWRSVLRVDWDELITAKCSRDERLCEENDQTDTLWDAK